MGEGGKAKGGKVANRSGFSGPPARVELFVEHLFARSKSAMDILEKNYCVAINLLPMQNLNWKFFLFSSFSTIFRKIYVSLITYLFILFS